MMKRIKPTRPTRYCSASLFVLYAFTIEARADSFLPFPNADQLGRPVFIQPFAGLAVVSEASGIGRTEAFFSSGIEM